MGELATRFLPVLWRKSWQYMVRKGQKRSAEYELEQRRKSLRLTLFMALCFIGICLYAFVSPLVMPRTNAARGLTTAATATQTNSQIAEFNDRVDQAEKRLQLSSSAGAALTAYPHGANNTLSSSSLDQQLKHQEEAHGAGNGGVALSQHLNAAQKANGNPPTGTLNGCNPQNGNAGSYGATTTPDYGSYLGCDASVGKDFLIDHSNGTWSGILFTLDSDLTVSNPIVTGLLQASEAVASALFVPMIVLVGVQIVTGSVTLKRANALESLPRFLFAIIASWTCVYLATAFLDFTDGFMGLLVSTVQGFPGIHMAELTSIIFPATTWGDWLFGLITIIVTLTIVLPVIAQIEVLGTSIGAYISVALALILLIVLWANMHIYLQVSLSIILAAQVFVRLLLINFYIILAPVAVVAAAIPGNQGVNFTRDWIEGFCALVLSQVAQILVLLIGLAVSGQYEFNAGYNGALPSGGDMVVNLMEFATLMLMLRVPSLFKSNATSLVTQIGGAVGGSVIGEYTKGFV